MCVCVCVCVCVVVCVFCKDSGPWEIEGKINS